MPQQVTAVEARILGSLVEKQLTTPEYYPLTLNALVNACNQKNNREPVMSLSENEVSTALEHLRDRNLVYVFYGSTSRVPKYKHMLPTYYELDEAGVAVMAVLMLRGPQTLGELRERTARMHEFSGLDEVQQTLNLLATREDPLVLRLERLPGQKDARFAQLLTGPVDLESIAAAHPTRAVQAESVIERISRLESEVERLNTELTELRNTLAEFRKQFE
jgi:uncharacterized protein YceH (UPF0502 family)